MANRNDKIVTAVENGAKTTKEIADEAGLAKSTVSKAMKPLTDKGRVSREKNGRGFVYFPADGSKPNSDDDDDGPSATEVVNMVMQALEDLKVASASEVAAEVDLSKPTVHEVIQDLKDGGKVAYDDSADKYFLPSNYDDDDGGDDDDEQETDEPGLPTHLQAALQDEADDVSVPSYDADDDERDPIPVDRNYDWESMVPSVDTQYRQYSDELNEIVANVVNRHESQRMPRFTLEGDAGTAKTLLAKTIASELGCPMVTLQCSADMTSADVVGRVHLDESSYWTDGQVAKALLASKDMPVVLLIDEINRAPPRRQNDMLPALDHRAELVLSERNGERIQGDPLNLITIATINSGKEYQVEPIDGAMEDRLGARYLTEYLGMGDFDAEVDLVANKSGMDKDDVTRLVKVANKIRKQADSETNRNVTVGISPRKVIAWAQSAMSLSDMDFNNPVVRAAKSEFIRPRYDGDGANEVTRIVTDALDGMIV